MDARSFPEALKLIMQARSWTQVRLGAELGADQATVSRIINGKNDPRMSTVMRLLDRVGLELHITYKSKDDDPVKRREFVTAAASVAFLPSSTGEPFQDPDYLRGLTRWLDGDRRERGGMASVPTAMQYVQRVGQAVKGRDRQVQAAASNMASTAVWTLADAGRFDLGDRVGRLALDLAQRSGDTDAHSRALSALTAVQVQRGDAGEAVRYALQAVRLREVPDVQRNYLTLRLGEALSKVPGQQNAARDAIDSLRATFADALLRNEVPGDVAGQLNGAGRVLYELGAYQEANACFDEAMRAGPGPLTAGFVLAWQAKVALRTREPDRAADQMFMLARVAPLVRSARLTGYLDEVLDLSAPWQAVSEMRAAREQLAVVLPSQARGPHRS